MPHYVIDTDDGRTFVPGDTEQSFENSSHARTAADRTLGAMTAEVMPAGGARVLRAIVRDETGHEVYVATVTFVAEWKISRCAGS